MSTPADAAAWSALLDEFERDLDQIVVALSVEPDVSTQVDAALTETSWRPPADLAPLPAELRPRATAIAERQRAVQQQVAARLHQARTHHHVVRTLDLTQPRPVYLDIQA